MGEGGRLVRHSLAKAEGRVRVAFDRDCGLAALGSSVVNPSFSFIETA
jgi:hypothetical protein